MSHERTSYQRFSAGLLDRANEPYVLQLYVAGVSPRSLQALAVLTGICERYLAGRYALTVIDIYQQPEQAVAAAIIAVPTLVRVAPEPMVRVIGDLSDEQRVLHGLDITPGARGA